MNPANAWLLLTTRTCAPFRIESGFGALQPADVAAALAGLDRTRFLMGMVALAGATEHLRELTAYAGIYVIDQAIAGNWQTRRGAEIHRRLGALAVFEVLNQKRCFVCNGKGQYAPPRTRPGDPAAVIASNKHLITALRRLKRLEWRAVVISKKYAGQKMPKQPTEHLRRVLRWIRQLDQLTDMLPTQAPCVTCSGSGVLEISGPQRAWLTGFSTDHWYRYWAPRYAPIHYEIQCWVQDCLRHVARRLSAAQPRAA